MNHRQTLLIKLLHLLHLRALFTLLALLASNIFSLPSMASPETINSERQDLLQQLETEGVVNACFTKFSSDTDKLTKQTQSPRLRIEGTTRAELTNTTRSAQESVQVDGLFSFFGANGDITLSSGATTNQAGFKLFEKDPCNVVYVTYRIKPWSDGRNKDQLNIQVKRNQHQSTSQSCGNNGYYTVHQQALDGSIAESDFTWGVPVHLQAKLDLKHQTICVRVKRELENTPYQGCYSLLRDSSGKPQPGADWAEGHIGLRTDNIQVEIDLFTPSLIMGQVITRQEINNDYWDVICE